MNILEVNDDCLLHVMSFCTIRDLLTLEQVCGRFGNLVFTSYKRYHILDSIHLENNFTIVENGRRWAMSYTSMCNILLRVGPYVKILILTIKYCPAVEHLIVSGEYYHFGQLGQYIYDRIFPSVKTLKIVKFRNLRENLKPILREVNRLEKLSLINCWNLSVDVLLPFKNIREIEFQTLNHMEHVHMEHFLAFCQNNPDVKKINIVGWPLDLVYRIVDMMPSQLKSLKTLAFGESHFPIGAPLPLRLKDLLQNVTYASMDTFYGFVGTFLETLLEYDRLEYLKLILKHSEDVPHDVMKFTKLKYLEFASDSEYTKFNVTDKVLDRMSCKKTIQSIYIPSSSVTNIGLHQFITECPTLSYVNIDRCSVTDKFLDNMICHMVNRKSPLKISAYRTKIKGINILKVFELSPKFQISFNKNVKYDLNWSPSPIFIWEK
ncbi:hypothetical protein DMENIID0001_045140 [Sergentomyia squamirostris]